MDGRRGERVGGTKVFLETLVVELSNCNVDNVVLQSNYFVSLSLATILSTFTIAARRFSSIY